MRIRDILRAKGDRVITIPPDHSVHRAMRAMMRHQIGALVVEAEVIEGIITERDILGFATRTPDAVDRVPVAEVMTRDVIVGVPEDRVHYVMDVMTKNRIRHLPIVDEGRVVGIVSMGDIVNALRSDMEAENRYMHDYIAGVIA